MSVYLPSSYTEDDRNAIAASDMSLDEVAQAIENGDETNGTLEDLLCYYVEQAGTLPTFMTGGLLSPDDPELQALWDDSSFVTAAQDLERLNVANTDPGIEELVAQLEAFLDTGGFDSSMVEDAAALVEEYEASHADDDEDADGDGLGDGGVLLTNAMSIAMAWGNPGLAILFYIMGSNTEYEVPDEAGNVDGEIVELNSDGESVTIHTENGDVEADLGETVNFHTTGLGEVVQDFQEAALDQYEELNEYIDDDLMDDLESVDYDSSEASYEIERIKRDMDVAKSVASTHAELIKMSQEILESLVETASSLLDLKFRTEQSIFR